MESARKSLALVRKEFLAYFHLFLYCGFGRASRHPGLYSYPKQYPLLLSVNRDDLSLLANHKISCTSSEWNKLALRILVLWFMCLKHILCAV